PVAPLRTHPNPLAIKLQLMPRLAHPSRLFCWVTDHQSIVGNSFGHHRTRANKSVFAYVMTADDGGIRPDRGAPAHMGACILRLEVDDAPGIDDVGEYHRTAEKHVIVAYRAGVNGDVVLHFNVVAQHDLRRHDHNLTDVAVLTDRAA